MKFDIRPLRRALSRAGAATVLGLLLGHTMIAAATSLADRPVLSNASVPGNLALALSVEWPTASRTAHVAAYTSASTYLGYFDPNKCYLYQVNTASNGVSTTAKGDLSYFYPAGAASSRTCTGKWSGNFLNWASTATIDPFRWAMTGGRRVVDTPTETILEKAWRSDQGGNLSPDRDLTVSEIAGATPFSGATRLGVSVTNRGFKMRLSPDGARRATPGEFKPFTDDSDERDFTIRVKVCDPSPGAGPLEANCKAYGANYKPEGLIQKYSQKIRFSAFGYLNESGNQRDGAVLRARQKFVGPIQPAPGQASISNTVGEWDASTGVMLTNPDSTDAATAATDFGVSISNSGVMNYLNKFGQLLPGDYKGNDPVGELYYATLRYFKNQGNVASWHAMGTADAATKATRLDGFPIIKTWDDPIQYSCQRNFVLGIGDIYTHADRNLPGNTVAGDEPTAPPEVSADTSVNAVTTTNKVGQLQGMGNDLGTRTNVSSGCCSNNGALMAGLAYDANTKDIRPDLTGQAKTIGKQTVSTYWVDVLEAPFVADNQFYLAAKFGGLDQKKLPAGFDPLTFSGTIPLDWWSTNGELLPGNIARPDNYFAAGQPDTLVTGLTKAFDSISNAIEAFTTSFSLSTVQVSSLGAASYAAQYDAKDWSGEVTASEITFASDGTPGSTLKWSSTAKLASQLASAGWDTNRRIATWSGSPVIKGVPFRYTSLTSAQQGALDPTYVTGNDGANYLNYLRGDRSQERTDADTTKPYRKRGKLLGDIVNAKVTPVGPPSMRYSNVVNPGYAAFKTANASRPTMVYAAANDGMLHAFNGALTGADAGLEQFAYVPGGVYQGPSTPATPQVDGLAQLGNPDYLHRYYVDSTPQVFDIDFGNAGGTFTTTTAGNSRWRSVLIGGLGKGGKSYYAIDVTDPASMTSEAAVAAKVLWEFSDPDMGLSYGEPTIVKTERYGWVVVLTSGYNNADGNGYLFFVHPETGALLQKVSTGAAATGMVHASAFIRDFTDGVADAVYAGDLDGQLWRFDVTAPRGSTGAYPAPVKLATLTDAGPPGTAQPITTRPLIEIEPQSRKRYVMLGTGQLLASTDITSAAGQSFYAIIDGNATAFKPADATLPVTRAQLTALTDLTNGVTLPNTSRGWYLDFGTSGGTALRLVSEATAFSGIVAFAALLPTGDECSASGQSRIYAIDFGTGKSVLTPVGAGYIQSSAAVTDLRFIGVDGSVRLVSGDVSGALRNNPFTPPAGAGLRLLNWREVPTVN